MPEKARTPLGALSAGRAARPARAVARKAGQTPPAADASAVREILGRAGARAQMAVSSPGDAFEHEADRVAELVARGQPAPLISRLPSSGALGRAEKKQPEEQKRPAQRKEARRPEEERKPAQRKEARRPEDERKPAQRKEAKRRDEDQKPIQRKDAKRPEEDKRQVQRSETKRSEEDQTAIRRLLQTKAAPGKREDEGRLQRKEKPLEEDRKGPIQRDSSSRTSPELGDIAERAVASKGSGRPLERSTRSALESSMGVDLSNVRVHDDADARATAQSLNARAFTHGSDIWLGPGESQGDMRLMAHEATHVVQQQSGLAQRIVQRDEDDAPGGAAAPVTPEQAERKLRTFNLPPIKARHRTRYREWAGRNQLIRTPGDPFNRGNPAQDGVWLDRVNLPDDELQRLHLNEAFTGNKTLLLNRNRELTGTRSELIGMLKIPYWHTDFSYMDHRFEVDHIVELQAGNWNGTAGEANLIDNMELLDKSSNASAGAGTKSSIRSNIRTYLRDMGKPSARAQVDQFLREPKLYPAETPLAEGIRFTHVELRDRGRSESGSKVWSKEQIQRGEQLRRVYPLLNVGEHGRANSYALVSPSGAVVIGEYAHAADSTTIHVTDENAQRRLNGLRLTQIQLNADYASAAAGAQVGTIQAEMDPPANVAGPGTPLTLSIKRVTQYSGYVDGLPSTIAASTPALSPIEFTAPRVDGRDLVAVGRISPTVPLLSSVPLELQLRGRDIQLAYTYDAGQIALPIPGLSIDDSSLTLSYGTRGFGAEGEVQFSINRLGAGSLAASISSARGFEASGNFSFDKKLFDRAEVGVSYRNGAFGVRGTIGIDNPNKIRGIRSAELTVAYEAGTFSANGRVSPSIPGVQEASLHVAYSETEGLTIGGTLALNDRIPCLRSGSVEAEVRRRPDADEYEVTARGTARPAIPGIESTLTIEYANGAFTAQVAAAYSRGMLSGSLQAGATNRVIGDDGRPTDEISPNLRAFGGGQLTIRIAPWLQGTIGVRILPNGELELSGEIALPSSLELFARKQVDKSLLNVAVQIPIVPGIVAEIGGGLSAQAGIGPGVIDQLRLGITYNPSHEENTHVTGDAHLNIPSDAGLRLAVRAGIGLGIPGASVTGGLEIGGLLGIAGAAQAGVHIDWTPSSGLRIDAFGELSAEPVFRFDISGYVSARALGFSIYENRWEFASFQFGSNMRFGARFPVHYVEGQPFDISLSDVEFIVPEINPREVLAGLIDRIA